MRRLSPILVLVLMFASLSWGLRPKPSPSKGGTRSAGSAASGRAHHASPAIGTMVRIPAGCFEMGSPSGQGEGGEHPQHHVCVSAFRMDATEVTQGAYQSVTGTNPSFFSDCGRDCPVETVDWNEANDYCHRVGKRLPTEAEWEYAARAGSTTVYSWGDDASRARRFAWFTDNSGYKTHRVRRKLASPWGLYDMAGNVWEWTGDLWGSYPSSFQQDPRGPSSGSNRVSRGGSWNHNAVGLRSAFRYDNPPGYRNGYLGFRCVSPE